MFSVFSVFYLGQPIRRNHIAGFALIALGAGVVFLGEGGTGAAADVRIEQQRGLPPVLRQQP